MTPTSIAGRIGSRAATVAALCLALGLDIGAAPAASATSVGASTAAQTRGAATPAMVKSCGHNRYGYHGILKCGDPKHGHIAMIDVTWRNGQKETFGIARTARSITCGPAAEDGR